MTSRVVRLPAPRDPVDVETEMDVVRRRRELVATPAYCREPGCRVVVTVEHPLPPGFPSAVTCSQHHGTPRNRYAEFRGPFGDPHTCKPRTNNG